MMNIREILLTLKSSDERKYIKGTDKAVYISKAINYTKKFIDEKICKPKNLCFYKIGYNFRTPKSLYKKHVYIRVFGNRDLKRSSLFCIMIYFDVDRLKGGIRIDRFSKRIGVSNYPELDKIYENDLMIEANKIAKELNVKGYKDKYEFDFNKDNYKDYKFERFLKNRLEKLLKVYNTMCERNFKFLKKPVNPNGFKIKTLGPNGLTTNSPKSNNDDNDNNRDDDDPKTFNLQENIHKIIENHEKGKQGEKIVNEKLHKMKGVQKIKWVSSNNPKNKNPKDNAGYDFKVIYKNKRISYIEVKATCANNFFLSVNELNKLKEIIKKQKSDYFVWVVNLNSKGKNDIYEIPGEEIIKPDALIPTRYSCKIRPDDFKD